VVNEIHADLCRDFCQSEPAAWKNDHAMLYHPVHLTQARNKQVVICKNGMAKFSV